jgi:hypothetical protein
VKRGGYLRRRTPLVSRGWPQGTSARRLAPRSKKADAFAVELDAITPLLVLRSHGLCEVCLRALATHRHHRLRRSQGGTNDLDNLLYVCSNCHELIHHYPDLSYEQGWLLRKENP